MRTTGKLTIKAIEGALRDGRAKRAGDGGGLWLQVAGSASSWLFRYTSPVTGKPRAMGLGAVEAGRLKANLDDMRERAAACRKQISEGEDPIEVRNGARAEALIAGSQHVTFKAAADQYIADHRAGWRNAKHADQWSSSLTAYAYPSLGKLPVAKLTPKLIADALRPIWNAKVETANRLRGRIETILDWTAAQGYRPRGDNPAQRSIIKNLLPARDKNRRVQHHASLPYSELGDMIAELRKIDSVGAKALFFTILTTARTGEAKGFRWPEYRGDLWTVPADRMKGHREHLVPLTTTAIEVVESMRGRDKELVFPGMRAGHEMSENTMSLVLKRLGVSVTVHGFRATFKTWSSEQTSTPNDVVEMCLAHLVGSDTERAYNRTTMLSLRRRHMEAWERFCLTPSVKAGGNVVSIGAAR